MRRQHQHARIYDSPDHCIHSGDGGDDCACGDRRGKRWASASRTDEYAHRNRVGRRDANGPNHGTDIRRARRRCRNQAARRPECERRICCGQG